MPNRFARLAVARVCWSSIILVCLTGCLTAGDYYRARLQSPIPLERGQAVVALEQTGDPDVIPALIETLEDPDAGVRLLAIQALQRMCGSDYGYRYYHDESRRSAAVERWREAVRNNEIVVRSSARHAAETTIDASSAPLPGADDELKPDTP